MTFNRTQIFHMKSHILTLALVCALSACGGSDPEPVPTESEKVTGLLTTSGGKWSLPASGGVTIDGVDVTDDLFPGFSITFQVGTFKTTGTSPVWLRQDTWKFKDESAKVILRSQDNREITISEISATQLRLTLEWQETTTSGGGRQASLKGKHEFILNK